VLCLGDLPVFSLRKNFPVFVTGATGFIGGQLAERLLADGRRVRVLTRRPLPALEERGAEIVLGDLHDKDALQHGCHAADTVFHVAGRVGVWGPEEDFHRVNVEGTRNIIAACREAKVPRLVYTSSPSVVFSGADLRNTDESAPLCTAAPCAYPVSKAHAEREVLAANSKDLATIALRPHLVWGPGDKNLVPRVLALSRAGKLKIIGPGRNKVDLTHISNVVDAHLLAEGALVQPDHPAAGRAYFITNGEPVVLWDWINELLRGLDLPTIKQRVPLPVAYAAGGMLEFWWRLTSRPGEPPMTRFAAKEMATDHWFNITAARRDLAYHPLMTMTEGTEELIAHYRKGNGC